MSVDGWTLAIQVVNVVVLVWILAHFFWKPVAGMIEERRAGVEKALAEAAAAREAVEAERREIAAIRAGFEKERDQLLQASREKARADAGEVLHRARDRVRALQEEAERTVARQSEEAERAWADGAASLALELAGKLLATGEGAPPPLTFLDELARGLSDLPSAQREPPPGVERRVVVRSAAPLKPTGEAACTERVVQALGEGWRVEVQPAPELVAGLEAEGPSFTVRSSWRAVLERAREELAHAVTGSGTADSSAADGEDGAAPSPAPFPSRAPSRDPSPTQAPGGAG